MADYYPLIARAVAGIDKNTAEDRRALYERARTALVAQLRAVSPALSEAEITRERLALEDAIRRVEADIVKQSRDSAKASPPPAAPAAPIVRTRIDPRITANGVVTDPGAAATPAKVPPAPPRPSLAESAVSQFRSQARGNGPAAAASAVDKPREGTPDAAERAGGGREAAGPFPTTGVPPAEARPAGGPRPAADATADAAAESRLAPAAARDAAAFDPEWIGPAGPPPGPGEPDDFAEEDEARPPRRSYRGLIRAAIVLLLLAGVAGAAYWKWSDIQSFVQTVRAPSAPKQPARDQTAPTQPKITDRLGVGPNATQPPPGEGQTVAVAQRVVLYEEDPTDPQGKSYPGVVTWRTETVTGGPGQPPDVVVRADVEVPERNFAMTWSFRRNTDQALPASHTIEVTFKLPPDPPNGGIANVPGVLMKQAEQARGIPLAGVAVKVTNGYFLIALYSVDAERERNVKLLKERSWFDVPIVYGNNRRAILAMEKGNPGERAFNEAFAAWGQ